MSRTDECPNVRHALLDRAEGPLHLLSIDCMNKKKEPGVYIRLRPLCC